MPGFVIGSESGAAVDKGSGGASSFQPYSWIVVTPGVNAPATATENGAIPCRCAQGRSMAPTAPRTSVIRTTFRVFSKVGIACPTGRSWIAPCAMSPPPPEQHDQEDGSDGRHEPPEPRRHAPERLLGLGGLRLACHRLAALLVMLLRLHPFLALLLLLLAFLLTWLVFRTLHALLRRLVDAQVGTMLLDLLSQGVFFGVQGCNLGFEATHLLGQAAGHPGQLVDFL